MSRTSERRGPGRVRRPWLRARVRLALALAALGAGPAGAQEAALFGRVADEAGVPVPAAAISLVGVDGGAAGGAVLTDAVGRYHLDGLRPGAYRLRADRLGYRRVEREVRLAPGERRRLDLLLEVDTVQVEGVVVEGWRDRERERYGAEPGLTARVVEGEVLKTLPGLAEADVLRAVEVLPGVVSTSDFSSAFHVRGGSADQNLILLDGVPIFNPFHLGGLFSVFNSDAIARAELLSGGFGAEYGGRVSSVLNVESDAGGERGLSGEGGVSLLASRLLLRSDLPRAVGRSLGGEGGRWLVSARRSYFDQLLRPVVDFPYHLTDLQAHAVVPTRGGGRLLFTAYGGEDVLDLSDFQPPGAAADSGSVLRIRWGWGNRVAGARWQQPLGGGWRADGRLGYSGYSERLGFVDFGDVRFSSEIGQLSLHGDLAGELSSTTRVRLGASAARMGYTNLAEAGGTEFFGGSGDGLLSAGYASLSWRPDARWIVEPGVRLDAWRAGRGSHTVVSPRFAVKRFLGAGGDGAVKLSVGRYAQFLHSLRNEELPVSNDTWVLADQNVPPVISDQLQLGVERYWSGTWYASAEVYHRSFRGITEFNLVDNPNDPTDDLLNGTGRSHGLDLLVRREAGRLTGWISLSLLRATRTLPNPLATGWDDVPPETTFPPVFDRRVDADLVLQYLLPAGVQVGTRWNYGSPLPYTRPIAQHFGWRHNPISGEYEPVNGAEGQPPLFVVPGERNASRYPPYHRLDLTLRRTFQRSWGSWTPYLQVLNLYNRRNVLFYFYDYDRLPPTRSGISMFPVLPALGVEASF